MSSSCRLYTVCHLSSKQNIPQTLSCKFLTHAVSTALCTSRCVFGRFTFVHLLDTHLTPYSSAFSQIAHHRDLLNHSSTGWFEICVCTPIPGGRPPSLMRHRN